MAHLLYAASAVAGSSDPQADPVGRWGAALKGLAAGVGTSVVVFVVVQPYALLDWQRFYADFVEQSEMVRRIRDYVYTLQYVDTTPYWYHVRQLATWGLGWPLGVVAWAGLLYASLRGMRPRYGIAYLVLGWGVPMAVLLYSNSLFAIVVASVIVFLALAATLPFRSPESRGTVLVLSWVAPYFLITGAFQVKFFRYLIPITPLLVLLGSRMLIALWDRATARRRSLRPWLAAGLALIVGATGFYAVSYMAVYSKPHTAVRTADWINANAPRGSVILKEHWEEAIPNLNTHDVRELAMYNGDGAEKLRRVSEELAQADYVVFYSNRLYGTIPRLPDRYPLSGEYYRLLFSGALGYELAHAEAAYPRLLGVSFLHDTLGRPELPEPELLGASAPGGLTLNLGFADESFSVYDHPVSLVFENVARHDAPTIRRTIESAAPPGALSPKTTPDRTVGLLLSPEDAEAQRQGGTWSEIIRDDSWTNRFPVLAWLILIEGIALLTAPLAFVLFRPLPDRGYLLAKPLGLLIVGLVVWLLASLHWLSFSRVSISLALLLLGAASTVTLMRKRREIVDFVRRRWPVILAGEVLFLAAFYAFVLVRMANPDLWHPFRGGEKPMDLAYLNAVLRSSYMPPYDPWFGGGYINYYYWGQFIVATLVRATGIDTAVAFNLAVPMFFAMTAGGAFSIVYNLAEGTRRTLGSFGSRWSPLVAGVGGAGFVAVLGNLDGAIQVGHGAWRALFRNMPFGEFDFWRSTRMMPPDPPGHEISEFPFFTFLFADLHAHLMALPFTLLALGLALAIVMAAVEARSRGDPGRVGAALRRWSLGEVALLATLGLVVGALRLINTWDFPTYMIVAAASVFLASYLRNGGIGLAMIGESGLKTALVFLVGYMAFLPFHLNYEPFFTNLESTTNETVLWQFLAIHGLFVFIIGSFFISESRHWLLSWWRRVVRKITTPRIATTVGWQAPHATGDGRGINVLRVSALVVIALVVGSIGAVTLSGWLGSTIPFLIALSVLVVGVGVGTLRSSNADAPQIAFVAGIVVVALALAIGLDIYRVEGDIDRMNSVFKFYLQIWVILALVSAYLLWRLAHVKRVGVLKLPWGKKVWLGFLCLLLLSASVYPVMGTQDRLRDRFDGRVLPLTLDGMAYMEGAVYGDRGGIIHLSSDLEAIRWIQGTENGSPNIEGSPIMLEGLTPLYRWGGRVSIYTGLPSVIGWGWHQAQQRWGYRPAVDRRLADVDRIYSTTDASKALSLMREYGVEYVYLGQLERLYYPEGIEKFEGTLSQHLDRVYKNEHVRIYKLKQEPPAQ